MKNTKRLFLLILMLLTIFITPSFATDTNTSVELATNCPSCILMETSTGKILYEKNAYEVRYPASTTKMMTAILAIEHCQLTDTATVSHDAIFTVPTGYSHASLREGEILTIEQLLNVLLIPSANDAANVLAEHISGSVSEFANLMNEKAKEIGCQNTHFVNPNGVHNREHVSTAYDLALIGNYAMKNATFRQIVKKTKYTLPATNQYDKADRVFNTTNDLLRENHSTAKDNYYYSYATGVKTGYTGDAGNCIVASAKKDNLEVIAVVLGGGKTADGLSQRNLDCITLFNYAFRTYELKTLCEKNEVIKEVPIFGSSKDTPNLELRASEEITTLAKKEENLEDVVSEVTLNEHLSAPVALGATVGKVTYEIDGNSYSTDLIAGNIVEASPILQIVFGSILAALVLFILYLLLKSGNEKDSNSSSKKRKGKKSSKRGNGHYRFTLLHISD
ncbi:MAG: D-alanyl-D-alanine carboxypeptidase [Clostridia bacterium]|nr:D-alanyl-D-alanine carboxypeptidase [Clostridia bacterium]